MTIEEHSDRIKELRSEIEQLDAEYELSEAEVAEIAVQINELRDKLNLARDRKQTTYYKKIEKQNEIDNNERRLARMRQEERERMSKEPDLTNPDLEKILSVVTEWPEWTKLRDYQKADLIFSWDRFLRRKFRDSGNLQLERYLAREDRRVRNDNPWTQDLVSHGSRSLAHQVRTGQDFISPVCRVGPSDHSSDWSE